MLDVAFHPDRLVPEPIYQQLADYLRSLIASGRIQAGEKLPATRELAVALGIGRNTAAQAYDRLIDDGVLLAHVGQGTFVASRAAARGAEPQPAAPRVFAWEGLYSRAARQPLPPGLVAPVGMKIRFDFRGGRVDDGAVPHTELRRAIGRAMKRDLPGVVNFSDPLGDPRLREQIARSLLSRGIECHADDVLVTAGAQQAIDLVARALVDPGDCVAVETPGYPIAHLAFRQAGARLIGIAVDDEGLRTDLLARAARSHRLKLIYTTPAAQLPTGVVLSNSRRSALLEVADETQTPILEDDYDSEFRFGEAAPPALKTRDAAGQVVYVGTFSKAIFPTLRLGYVVAARPLLRRLATARWGASLSADALSQLAMAELMATGAFEAHVRRLRRHYAERRAALISALKETMPPGTRWNEPQGGLQVWLQLPPGVPGDVLQREALTAGIVYASGRAFQPEAPGNEPTPNDVGANHLGLCFASQSPDSNRQGIEELAALVRSVARRPTGREQTK